MQSMSDVFTLNKHKSLNIWGAIPTPDFPHQTTSASYRKYYALFNMDILCNRHPIFIIFISQVLVQMQSVKRNRRDEKNFAQIS